MTIAASWRGNPYAEGAGAFVFDFNVTLTTNWSNVIDIRGMSARTDVAEAVEAQGLAAADVAERAVIKRVIVQNMAAVDAHLSRRAAAAVGTAGAPNPSDAYLVVQQSGGSATLDAPTRMELLKVQAKAASATAVVNVICWFDVPDLAS